MSKISLAISMMDKIIEVGNKMRAVENHLACVKDSKIARHLPDLKRRYKELWDKHDEFFEQFTNEWREKHGKDH